MADTRISDLTALTGASLASTDLAVVVDVSDTSMASSGTDKKTTVADLATAITSVGALATTTAVAAGYQPLDSDLTAIAALTTTTYGRAFLALADAAAARTALSLGTAAVADTGTGASNVPTITQADARYQATDTDLTALAGLAGVQGDIIYRDATQWQRLAAGTSGQVLQTGGAGANPSWATASGGGGGSAAAGASKPGLYHIFAPTATGSGAALNGNAVECCFPYVAPRSGTIDRIAINCTSVGSAGSVARVGIRSDDGNGYPSATVLADAGTAATDSTGVKAYTVSQAVTAGTLYWISVTPQGSPATQPQFRRSATAGMYAPWIGFDGTSPDFSNPSSAYCQTGVSGALPSSFSSTVSTLLTTDTLIGVRMT